MTRNEALLHLPVAEGSTLEEVFDEKLFYWKNFFVNRFPVTKLYERKVQQLRLLQVAYEVLEGASEGSGVEITPNTSFPSELAPAFHHFAEERNALKVGLFRARTATDVIEIANALVELTRAYARVWEVDDISTDGVVVSKEVDPMDLLAALKDAERKGVRRSADILNLPEGHAVRNEAKRLSLWLKMDFHE
jgi:hypothetical protein